MEDLGEKLKNPCLKNFFGVTCQKLALVEVEESQGFLNVNHSKSQNGFFIMSSLCLIELIETDKIVFGWLELILSTFKDLPSTSD